MTNMAIFLVERKLRVTHVHVWYVFIGYALSTCTDLANVINRIPKRKIASFVDGFFAFDIPDVP
jgi:hypothetical protein